MIDKCEMIAPGTVRFERYFDAPVETVWAFLVEPDKRAQWLAGGEMELRPGANFTFVFENGTLCEPGDKRPAKYDAMGDVVLIQGRVLKAEPPKLLSFLMFEPGTDEADQPGSEITFVLTEQDGGTALTLTQKADFDTDALVGTAAGWHAHMDVLRGALESDAETPSYWSRYRELEVAYAKRFAGAA